jgi:hypothetical protein
MTIGRKRGSGRWLAVSFLCVLFVLMGVATLCAAPKLSPKAKGGDCAACHGQEKVLPESHPPTKAMNGQGCLACHKKGEKLDLTGKLPGSHVHQLAGVTCVGCHGKAKKQEALKMDKCVACHGSTDKLAEKTAQVKPENPHTSPHYGTALDSNLCHHQHAKSENFCAQCHQFNFKVP